MNLDAHYWNNRYQTDDFPWDIGYISPPLKNYFDKLSNKELRILIPGAGNAHEAEYLFSQGFKNVFIVEISEEAIKNFTARNPHFPAENIFFEDFFDHNKKYDLIVEQTFFCALDPSLREAYVKKMHELLTDGGILAGLLFHDAELKGNPPFGGTKEEYIPIFEKHFELLKFDMTCESVKPRLGRELFIEVKNK